MTNETFRGIEKLESDLWEAADNLRANSKLTSSDYFMPVLGVIFLRHAVHDAGVLVAGEAEADQPLAVQLQRRFLQQRHPPAVVLDQVVVGGENIGDALLDGQSWQGRWKGREPLQRDSIDGCPRDHVARRQR